MNNRSIRTALMRAGLKQYHLAEILGCSEGTVSIMLKRELSRSEQRNIVEQINKFGADYEKDKND